VKINKTFASVLWIASTFSAGCLQNDGLNSPCADCSADGGTTTGDAATPDSERVPRSVFVSPEERTLPRGSVGALSLTTPQTARRIVTSVAVRQLATLADGDYGISTWETVTRNRPPRGIAWNYPWGVTLYGMQRATEVTGDRAYADFALRHNAIVGRYYQYLRQVDRVYGPSHRAEVDRMLRAAPITGALQLGSLDNCGAMSNQMLEGLLRHGGEDTAAQGELLSSVAGYIARGQARLPDGALWRPEQGRTLWIDDLYMSCPFLTRWSERTGDGRFLDDAAWQVISFAQRQQDRDGLWYHGNFVAESRPSPYKWGRGNGWAMVSTVEVLSALPEGHRDRARLIEILRRHVDGVRAVQAPSGRWHQVLDHPELWEETSCTAMFTYAITRAVRRGWLPREYLDVARRGLAGLAENVTAQGEVNGTGWGTAISTSLEYYASIPRPPNDAHGSGPVLLAATEALAESSGQ
jgi:rhamnogalacturonyl hydrolase YesR